MQVKVSATLACLFCVIPILVVAALAASCLTRARGAPVVLFLMMMVPKSTEIYPIHHRNQYFASAQKEAFRHCLLSNENTSGVLFYHQLHIKGWTR